IATATSTIYRYDPQRQLDTSSTSGTTKGCAELRLRTLRSANCIVSRPASAHRQLIIESMKFVDRQRQTGLSLAEVLIAVLLPGLSLQSVFAITESVLACLMLAKRTSRLMASDTS